MNILMMTNTFTPHVGGVARSVQSFANGYRKRGHRVLVVAPEYENMPGKETDVIRVPAIQHFNRSDFSMVLPIPGFLTAAIEKFSPDIVHAQHPFLIGGTAIRVAHTHELPLVFTHHTMYEQYTHYVPSGVLSSIFRSGTPIFVNMSLPPVRVPQRFSSIVGSKRPSKLFPRVLISGDLTRAAGRALEWL